MTSETNQRICKSYFSSNKDLECTSQAEIHLNGLIKTHRDERYIHSQGCFAISSDAAHGAAFIIRTLETSAAKYSQKEHQHLSSPVHLIQGSGELSQIKTRE